MKKYKLLKDYSTLDLTAKAADVGELGINEKVWFDNNRYFFFLSQIKMHPTWFEELVTEPSMPERIKVIKVWSIEYPDGGTEYKFNTTKLISEDKLSAIKQAIENVLNDTVVGGGVDVEFKMERFYTQSEVDAIMEDTWNGARYLRSADFHHTPYFYDTLKDYKDFRATLPLQQQSKKQSPYNDRNGKPIFEGDTVKGVNKHIGQSEVFFAHDRWQPFDYLNDYDGNNYEIVPPLQQVQEDSDKPNKEQEQSYFDQCAKDFEAKDKPFVWTDDLVAECISYSSETAHSNPIVIVKKFIQSKQSPTNLQESKEEDTSHLFRGGYHNQPKPQPSTTVKDKQEWEIVSYKHEGIIYDEIGKYGNYYSKEMDRSITWDDKAQIHSVKRLSDNTVFSIGEVTKTKLCHDTEIESFKIENGNMVVYGKWVHGMNGYCDFADLIKLPTPNTDTISTKTVFTTEDGFSVPANYDGEMWRVFITPHSYEMWKPYNLGLPFIGQPIPSGEKYFSTKEAAEKYITEFKPCLSVWDVMDAVKNESYSKVGYALRHCIEQKVKEKLKQQTP